MAAITSRRPSAFSAWASTYATSSGWSLSSSTCRRGCEGERVLFVVFYLGVDEAGDFAWLGVAAERFLAEDERVVDFYLETAAAGRKQRQAGDIM